MPLLGRFLEVYSIMTEKQWLKPKRFVCITNSLFSGLQGPVTKTMCQITMAEGVVPLPQLVLLEGVATLGVALTVPLTAPGSKFLSKDNGGSEEMQGVRIDEEEYQPYNEGILHSQPRFPLGNLQGVRV